MIIIVNASAENPYKNSLSYHKKSTIEEAHYQGTIYSTQITYERQINLCCRIIRVALCLLATITLIPLCVNASLITKWWNQATTGVDQKIVLIKNRKQPPPPKDVPPPEEAKPFKRSRDVLKELFQKENDSTRDRTSFASPISPAEKRQKSEVRFENVRARLFDKADAPAKVADAASFNLANLENSRESLMIPQPQQRKIPPLSGTGSDTIIIDPITLTYKSVHGTTTYFADEDIAEVLPILQQRHIGNGIYAYYTQHGKAIIQQQATRGCTAATAAMLSMDHGAKADLFELRDRNLGNHANQIRDLRKAGIIGTLHDAASCSDLRNLILKHGSAIVNGMGSLSGHVYIVDDISEDFNKVRIRDPYHGWEITVKGSAFISSWRPGKALQVTGVSI